MDSATAVILPQNYDYNRLQPVRSTSIVSKMHTLSRTDAHRN